MQIKSVAVLGAGAVGSYVIWGLSSRKDIRLAVITGYLCDPYDAHQFADAIEKIVNLPSEERAKMVIACKEKAKEFDISKSIAAMKNIYQEVLCHDGE